ncbi:hypothetical protein CO614_02845 [Lysobacteraceae bacterium NML120232]|nr:hypothetical protein CO608_05855 [Xanthomonadaceae bacterium NML08-0793]PJK13060.1 hypothetical protein CO614_02845 [Xanthomonadaceae bacterium NML120232]
MACAEPPKRDEAAAPVVVEKQTALAVSIPVFTPREGVYSAGQPAEQDWQAFAAKGVTTVVNMRGPDELAGRDEKAEVTAAGMKYLELPIVDGSAINAENAARLHQLLQQADGPVLLHCGSANRSGGLLALMAALHEGKSPEEALALGRSAGMKSTEAAVRAALNLQP